MRRQVLVRPDRSRCSRDCEGLAMFTPQKTYWIPWISMNFLLLEGFLDGAFTLCLQGFWKVFYHVFTRLLQCFVFEVFRRPLQGVCEDIIGFCVRIL
jgi:hypothetical protein